jgi:hypothetical protein
MPGAWCDAHYCKAGSARPQRTFHLWIDGIGRRIHCGRFPAGKPAHSPHSGCRGRARSQADLGAHKSSPRGSKGSGCQAWRRQRCTTYRRGSAGRAKGGYSACQWQGGRSGSYCETVTGGRHSKPTGHCGSAEPTWGQDAPWWWSLAGGVCQSVAETAACLMTGGTTGRLARKVPPDEIRRRVEAVDFPRANRLTIHILAPSTRRRRSRTAPRPHSPPPGPAALSWVASAVGPGYTPRAPSPGGRGPRRSRPGPPIWRL